jgi:MutS domain V
MKAFLMHRDHDFILGEGRPSHAADLSQDLELPTLFRAMAADDKFLFGVAESAVLASLLEPGEIEYRQQILTDCLAQSDVVREIYATAVEAIEREKKVWGWMSGKYPESTLHRSVEVLQVLVALLKRLRNIADTQSVKFRSDGFKGFFRMMVRELDDGYLASVDEHLERLKFRDGVVMSAELGKGNQGTNYILRKTPYVSLSWMKRLQVWLERLANRNGGAYVYEVHERDEAGFRALSELRSRGICHVAAALAQSTDHILSFFSMLRLELGFYMGCLNLCDLLVRKNEPICFPESLPIGRMTLASEGLYDVCLSLNLKTRVVGNDIEAEDASLLMVTGANRGGKSTFLRGIGLAQLMMQCGMFVPAESFRANVSRGIFTHFKREEDASMKSGKLDEELSRMSGMVDKITPYSMVLFNESFACTNEREGSEIARQIVRALQETDVKVVYVTHMFDLAHGFYLKGENEARFLRAERLVDGQRTFRLVPGEPLPTSYGEDMYRRIFEAAPEADARIPA